MYQTAGDYQLEVLNVRAPLQTNGIVRVLRHTAYKENNDMHFFFSVTLKVVDSDGVAIEGATVTMTDTDSGQVTDDSDVNGDVVLKVKSYSNVTNPADEYGTYVDLNPFVLTVEKTGYTTYTESDIDFYDKIDQTIALQLPEGVEVPETALYGSELHNSTIY